MKQYSINPQNHSIIAYLELYSPPIPTILPLNKFSPLFFMIPVTRSSYPFFVLGKNYPNVYICILLYLHYCYWSLLLRIWILLRIVLPLRSIRMLFFMVWRRCGGRTTIARYFIIGILSCFRWCRNFLLFYLRNLNVSSNVDNLPSNAVIYQFRFWYRFALHD